MKKEIRKQSESEILKSYPIKGKLIGWYFRVVETSNNAWEAEGSDLWGRKVQCSGFDPEALIAETVEMAKQLNV